LFRVLNAHLPWLLMMIIISVQSSMSILRLPDLGIGFADKIMHLIVFGVLGWLIARGMHRSEVPFIQKKILFFTLLLGGLFGLMDEWHQSTVPGRQSDIKDWLADIAGIIIFAIYYKLKMLKTED